MGLLSRGPSPASKEIVITGTLSQLSRSLDPANAPYDDGLWFGTIGVENVISGSYSNKSAIVVFLAMRNRQPSGVTQIRPMMVT